MPDRVYDGDFSEAERESGPVFSAPLTGVNTLYVLTEEVVQREENIVVMALNTQHPEYQDFVLVSEGPHDDAGQGLRRWTRTYAKVPDSYSEPGGNYPYNFIGLEGDWGSGVASADGRGRFTRNVLVKVQRDFYLIGPGQTYTTFYAIPSVPATHYYDAAGSELEVDYLRNNPPFAAATVPSRTTYLGWITADAATPTAFSIVVEDSIISRWMGNIYMRETRYVKAL